MSNRLNQEREHKLQPIRMVKAILEIEKLGYEVAIVDGSELLFIHKNETIKYFPYSGWATGSTIKDGRGLKNLLKQLK